MTSERNNFAVSKIYMERLLAKWINAILDAARWDTFTPPFIADFFPALYQNSSDFEKVL